MLACTSLSALAETEIADTLTQIDVVSDRLKRTEQNIAVSSNTIYIKQIEQEQRLNYKDFSSLVPNLYVPDYGSNMTSSVYVRGLGARIDKPVLGMYIDGIAVANKNAYDQHLIDTRSAEVFRGPQGTLFGKNTIGGILNINTLSAFDFQGTRASIGYGNHNTADIKVSHYRLLSPSWALAAAGYYHYTKGFFRNIFDDTPADRQYQAGARLKIDGKTKSGIEIRNQLNYNFSNQTGFPYHLPSAAVNHNDYCGYLRHNLMAASSYSFPLEKVVLTGSTSYQLLWDDMQMDQDYMPLQYFTLEQKQQEHSVNQELSLRPTNASEHYDWLAGVSLQYTHQRMSALVNFKQDGIDSLILKNANYYRMQYAGLKPISLRESELPIDSRFLTQSFDAALYHTSFFHWKGWKLEVGARLEFEYQHFDYSSEAQLDYIIQGKTDYHNISTALKDYTSLSYIEVLPRIAVGYQSDNQVLPFTVYGSVSEGYKAGGFNTQLFSDILQNLLRDDMMHSMGVYLNDQWEYDINDVITYKPERCLNFEIGATINKRWQQSSLTGSLSIYELEVFNQQMTVFPEKGTGRYMTNAGRSRSIGGEASVTFKYKDLSLRSAYGYTNARFIDYFDGKNDYKGKYVPYAPQNTLYAAAEYTFRFNSDFFSSLTININTDCIGSIYWDEQNLYRQPFYALLGANITLQMRHVEWQVWGKNLTNTSYDVFHFVSMGNHFMQSGKTISFGTSLTVQI